MKNHSEIVVIGFASLGHTLCHLLTLLFPTVLIALEKEMGLSYKELATLAIPAAFLFGAASLPAGWLGDRWSKTKLLEMFFYGTGIFMFLNPQPGDSFKANNGGNEKYLAFCEAIKINCPEIEVDVDGEKRMVKQFPELSEDEIVGSPIRGFVDIEEYKDKDGETRKSFKVKHFSDWADGKKDDGVPF